MQVIRVRGDTTLQTVQGDSKKIPIVFKKDGIETVISSVQGFEVRLTMRNRLGDVVLSKRETLEGSRAEIWILPEESEGLVQGFYDYDLQLSSPDGSRVTTLVKGRWAVYDDVTEGGGV